MSKIVRLGAAIVVFSAFTLALPVPQAMAAQGRGHGRGQADKAKPKDDKDKDKNKNEDKDKDKDKTRVIVVDRDSHVRVIHEYVQSGSLPPGLAKRRALPPGLRNQLRENGALPPGLQKHLIAVPAPLGSRLPPVPPYYHRYFAGDDFLVIDTRTNRVIAIIRDVWR